MEPRCGYTLINDRIWSVQRNKLEFILTANSPGEIIGWIYPLSAKIRRSFPDSKINLFLLPCTFASGREEEVARSFNLFDRVLNVKSTLSVIISPGKWNFKRNSILVHLGGDPLYAVLISQRLKTIAWAYRWAQKKWDWNFAGYFAEDEKNKNQISSKGINPQKIYTVGSLLVDSVKLRSSGCPFSENREDLTVTFMPGSRFNEIRALTPLFAATSELIINDFPNSRFLMPISPFIDWQKFLDSFPMSPQDDVPGVEVALEKDNLLTPSGVEISLVQDQLAAVGKADFAVTIPGTSTAELGILGTPFLCVVPTNRPEEIPMVGIVGLTGYIPLAGKWIKRKIIKYMEKKAGLVALPNIKAQREIAPEIIGVVDPALLYQCVKELLEDRKKRGNIKKELLDLYSDSGGAAEKIVNIIKLT